MRRKRWHLPCTAASFIATHPVLFTSQCCSHPVLLTSHCCLLQRGFASSCRRCLHAHLDLTNTVGYVALMCTPGIQVRQCRHFAMQRDEGPDSSMHGESMVDWLYWYHESGAVGLSHKAGKALQTRKD